MCLYMCWCSSCVFRKKRLSGGEAKPSFCVFWNPSRSDKALEFEVGCTVILTQEMCPHTLQRLHVPLAAVMDMPLSLPPHMLVVPEEAHSWFLPFLSLHTAELVLLQQVKPWRSFPNNLLVTQGVRLHFHSPLLGQEHWRYSNPKKWCKILFQSSIIVLLSVSWVRRTRIHPFALSILPCPEQTR